MNFPIYLDNHATTPVDPKVFEAMTPYFLEKFGNASSKSHSFGREANISVDVARKQIGEFIGAVPEEIYFTSGSTESINLSLFGITQSYYSQGKHIITSSIEHSAVNDSVKLLENKGFEITYLSVDENGLINLEELKESIREDTILVSIIAANNEIGTIQDMKGIGKICNEKNVLFHSDATQAIGKIPFNVNEFNLDLVSFSAHKFYGPKGIGALFIKNKSPKIRITPQLYGGGQENGIRSGTLNVPGIIGLAKAISLCKENFVEENKRIKNLRDKLFNGLKDNIKNVKLNGSLNNRLSGNLNVSFKYVKSSTLISELTDIAISSGSACATGSIKPGRILKAIGLTDDEAFSSVRFGIGRFNTNEEIDYTIIKISDTVNKLKKESPEYKLSLENPV